MVNSLSETENDDFMAKVVSLIDDGQLDNAVEILRSLEDTKESISALRALVAAVIAMITRARDRVRDRAHGLDREHDRALERSHAARSP